MGRTMQGVCLTGPHQLELREFNVPKPGPGMVLIKVKRVGICGTDVGYWRHGGELTYPIILGHEVTGVVVEAGEGVAGLSPGDRIVVTNDYHLCGTCRFCKAGDTNLCPERRSIGWKEQGAFAHYLLVPQRIVLPLPDNIGFAEGALLEVFSCSMHALTRQASLSGNGTVLILGPGAIGGATALTAKAMGCTVIAAGLGQDAWRLELLQKMGVDYTCDLEAQSLERLVLELTGGLGVDLCAECSGSYRALDLGISLTARKGRFLQIGILHGSGQVDLSRLVFREIQMAGSFAKTDDAWRRAIQLFESGRLDVSPLVSRTYPLEAYREAFAAAESPDTFKVMFDPEAGGTP